MWACALKRKKPTYYRFILLIMLLIHLKYNINCMQLNNTSKTGKGRTHIPLPEVIRKNLENVETLIYLYRKLFVWCPADA